VRFEKPAAASHQTAEETPGFRRLGQECVGSPFHRLRWQCVASRDFPLLKGSGSRLILGLTLSDDGSREAAEHHGQGRGGHGRYL
jgi:hypothetical protein